MMTRRITFYYLLVINIHVAMLGACRSTSQSAADSILLLLWIFVSHTHKHPQSALKTAGHTSMTCKGKTVECFLFFCFQHQQTIAGNGWQMAEESSESRLHVLSQDMRQYSHGTLSIRKTGTSESCPNTCCIHWLGMRGAKPRRDPTETWCVERATKKSETRMTYC